MSTVMSQKIYDEGKAAKAAGQGDGSDPYEVGSQESADWLAGYTADEQEPSTAGPDPAAEI